MSKGTVQPKAHVHRKILDSAASRPEATVEEITDQVDGATTELVERVLEDYGDPGEDDGVPVDDDPSLTNETDRPTSVQDLTEVQRETIRAISEYPDASQRELAELLGVSPATINQRVNAIDGFEWRDREVFARTLLGEASTKPDGGTVGSEPIGDERQPAKVDDTIDQLEYRVQRLEDRVKKEDSPTIDPDLLHKVAHACMTSDVVSEDEELELLRALLGE